MRLDRRSPEQDRAKASIYNPREFRGRRSRAVAPGRGRRVQVHVIVGLACGIAAYLWSDELLQILGSVMTTAPGLRASAPPQALPSTGAVERFRQEPAGTAQAPLTLIGNRDGRHCVFRLEDWEAGAPALSVFVRGRETAQAAVSAGTYRAKIACGSTWHGADLFGPATAVDELAAPLVFAPDVAGGMRGMLIDLTQRPGGNLQALPSRGRAF